MYFISNVFNICVIVSDFNCGIRWPRETWQRTIEKERAQLGFGIWVEAETADRDRSRRERTDGDDDDDDKDDDDEDDNDKIFRPRQPNFV